LYRVHALPSEETSRFGSGDGLAPQLLESERSGMLRDATARLLSDEGCHAEEGTGVG
jgi:hypothetical protein